jgi:hypothetical protein
LPATGISLEWERRLSAAFIVGEESATARAARRSSCWVAMATLRLSSALIDPAGNPIGEVDLRFALTAALRPCCRPLNSDSR